MAINNYLGADKAIKDALVENRGAKVASSKEQRINELERKLDSEKLSNAEIAEIRKQLIRLSA